jgi:hypothetical protein
MFSFNSFFSASDGNGVLLRQTQFFGYKKMTEVQKLFNSSKKLSYYEKRDYLEYVLPHTRHLVNKESIQALKKILEPNPYLRPTPREVLELPFFNE